MIACLMMAGAHDIEVSDVDDQHLDDEFQHLYDELTGVE